MSQPAESNAAPVSTPRCVSGKAIVSFILGIISCILPLLLVNADILFYLLSHAPVYVWHTTQVALALLGTIFGIVCLREIGHRRQTGRWMAFSGITLCVTAILVITPSVLYFKIFPTVMNAKHQTQSMLNLQTLVRAIHKYHDTNGRFPPAVVFNKEGKPLYSWRVLLLPFLGHGKLYQQFKLDEAWDNPGNKALLKQIPRVYASPNQSALADDYATSYMVFDGKGAIFETFGRPKWFDDDLNKARTASFQIFPRPGEPPVYDFGKRSSLPSISDGPANTILLVEADERVPWTMPYDLPYAADQPLPRLGGHYHGEFVVALADGSVRIINKQRVSEKTIRDAITANDGELPQSDWYDP